MKLQRDNKKADDMRIKDSIMIHQPHYFPWPPYMARVVLSEEFVVLNDVPYRKNYYQNRSRLIDKNGRPLWFTLAIKKHSNGSLEQTKLASDCHRFINKSIKTIEQNYSKSQYFPQVWDTVRNYLVSIGAHDKDNLASVSTESIKLMCTLLGLQKPEICFSSELGTCNLERTNRILKIIELTGKQVYLNGWGAGTNPIIHNIKLLSDNGITIKTMNKKIATKIDADFVLNEGASTLHWLFIKGPQYVRDRLLEYKAAMS